MTAPLETPPFDHRALREMLEREQHGVVSARQRRELYARPHDVKRMLRRRELTVLHPGVFIDHTGPPTWHQRAWGAVLAHWPAALTWESALPQPAEKAPLHIAVAHGRAHRPIVGVVIHRTTDLDTRVRWNADPPTIRLEQAVIDVASARIEDPAAAFRVIADACQTRRTTPERIAAALEDRQRVRGRALLNELVADLSSGACSVLEREWLRLERLHGLPVAERQRAASAGGRLAYRDAVHEEYDVAVELDGLAFHDTAISRDRDAERDLDAAVENRLLTVRLTYGQVYRRGCLTVDKVAQLLSSRGWPGQVLRCPHCPTSSASA